MDLDERVALQLLQGKRVIQPAQRDEHVGADRDEADQRRGQPRGTWRPRPGLPVKGRLGGAPRMRQDARAAEDHATYYMASGIPRGGNSSYELMVNQDSAATGILNLTDLLTHESVAGARARECA